MTVKHLVCQLTAIHTTTSMKPTQASIVLGAFRHVQISAITNMVNSTQTLIAKKFLILKVFQYSA